MELWIRSQEGTLGKVLFIRAAGLALDVHFAGNYVTSEHFKTEERALEVLDDIEDKLINCTFAKKQNGLGEVLDFMPNSIYVYTMPKE